MSNIDTYAEKIEHIQNTLRRYQIDGWLLYNFRQFNVFANKILEVPTHFPQMRRYFYFIPANGIPRKIVHAIEQHTLDHLPGEKSIYINWQSLHEGIRKALGSVGTVAMEYSPMNAIPYVSRVDAGTIEMVRSMGVTVVTSADIVQFFEARWSEEQRQDQFLTMDVLRKTVDVAFNYIGEKIRTGNKVTEYDVQQKMLKYFQENQLTTKDAPNCSVNANGANPHYEPTDTIFTEIHRGDYVLIDLWAKKNTPGSVYGDITWVAYVGEKIPKKYHEVFEIVKASRDAAVAFVEQQMKIGKKVCGCDVDDVARKVIADHGYGDYFIHRTGHNVGEETHGNGANIDNLETNDQREILPETAFSIEPGIYLPGEFGVRSEIIVYISADRKVVVPGQPIQQEIVRIQC